MLCEQISGRITSFQFGIELRALHRVLNQFCLVLGAVRNVISKNGGGQGFMCHLLTHSLMAGVLLMTMTV